MKAIHTGLILITTLLCLPSADLLAGGGFKGGGGGGGRGGSKGGGRSMSAARSRPSTPNLSRSRPSPQSAEQPAQC